MKFEKLESMLGKLISFAKKTIGKEFVNELFGKDFYYTHDFTKKNFFGMPYNSLSILTDENEIVQSVKVHFQDVINRQFYDSFIKKYGEPNTIKVVDKSRIIIQSIDDEDNFSQQLTKREITLKDGSFDDKPLFVIWEKEKFQIRVFLKHKENRSEIEFSISTK